MTKTIMLIGALAVLTALAAPPPVAAQTSPLSQPSQPSPRSRHVRHRIEIHPRPLFYRRCVDWYELQHRPSGTVLYPQMRCWWVRG
ncbi:MAG TPA: hypothetical protein VEK75_18125 [Xanthobacteraceae bacterium]|nr:hypothetical protein [Xanthobacteraceae bacterium]